MNRAARETLPNYRELSYYEIWLAALEKLLAEGRAAATPPPRRTQVLRAELVAATLARGTPFERAPARAARFAVGDRVRMRADQPAHHTRLPATHAAKSAM